MASHRVLLMNSLSRKALSLVIHQEETMTLIFLLLTLLTMENILLDIKLRTSYMVETT